MRAILAVICLSYLVGPAVAQVDDSIKTPPVVVDEPNPVPIDSPIPAVLVPCEPVPAKNQKRWTGNIDLGLNGSSGNTEAFNIRMFAATKKQWGNKTLLADVLYNYSSASGLITQDNLQANSRFERSCGDSAWNCFVSGGLQYDTFRAFDLLIFGHSGLGYTWWNGDLGFLKTRVGFGGSYPIGGPDQEFAPEALMGMDYERKLLERMKFVFSGVVYPDLAQSGEFRATVNTFLDFLVDPNYNIGFKIGAVDNYISNPQGRKPNDLNYYAAVTWKY